MPSSIHRNRLGLQLVRCLSSSSTGNKADSSPLEERMVTATRQGGVPDFIHDWGPAPFRRTGYALAAATAGAAGLSVVHELGHIVPVAMGLFTAGYWTLGLRDLSQKHQALRKNFPVLIHFRYMLESLRPEIQQYLIESDEQAVPFSREMRSIIYQRSKGLPDTRALGTKRNVYAEGHEWAAHSMFPKHLDHSGPAARVRIGGPDCTRPYEASLLNISAMSYGALSGNAISALNVGARLARCYHNTGEGGISQFHKGGGADLVWNLGTGYFACGASLSDGGRVFDPQMFTENARLDSVKMIEIKLSQGAKPAHGGVLPSAKITPIIADARGLGAPPWADCNSPPCHSAFSSAAGLMRFVSELRELSAGKPVGIKLCVGQPAELAALVHAMLDTGVTPDFITVDGAEGGTGAAPLEFQNSVGFPLAEGLRLVDALLVGAGLRDRVKLIGSGKVYNGFSLVRTLAHGADLTNSARAFMFSLGCIQALKCNSNSCPTGIATQNPDLESGLDVDSKSTRVARFHAATLRAALEIVGAIGVDSPSFVKPVHLFRRESGFKAKDFTQLSHTLFPTLDEPGCLLGSTRSPAVPDQLHAWWEHGAELHAKSKQLN